MKIYILEFETFEQTKENLFNLKPLVNWFRNRLYNHSVTSVCCLNSVQEQAAVSRPMIFSEGSVIKIFTFENIPKNKVFLMSLVLEIISKTKSLRLKYKLFLKRHSKLYFFQSLPGWQLVDFF